METSTAFEATSRDDPKMLSSISLFATTRSLATHQKFEQRHFAG